jgi:hypothetical protein
MGAELHARNGIHQISRETWGKDVHQLGDLRFFIGQGDYSLWEDEIRVDVPDDKSHILYKTVELLKWAVERSYDMILKIDTDTYINIGEMSKQNYEGFDYIGAPVGRIGEIYGNTNVYGFLQGSATWLSAKAAKIVIEEAIPNMLQIMPEAQKFNGTICPYPHSEDMWIAQVLTPYIKTNELRAWADDRYAEGPLTFHFARDKTKSSVFAWMKQLHEAVPDVNKMKDIHSARESMVGPICNTVNG